MCPTQTAVCELELSCALGPCPHVRWVVIYAKLSTTNYRNGGHRRTPIGIDCTPCVPKILDFKFGDSFKFLYVFEKNNKLVPRESLLSMLELVDPVCALTWKLITLLASNVVSSFLPSFRAFNL
jgi:hypothetical protein